MTKSFFFFFLINRELINQVFFFLEFTKEEPLGTVKTDSHHNGTFALMLLRSGQ